MIPELTDNVLPEGMHPCTIDDLVQAFGQFQRTDRRIKLTAKLKRFVAEAQKSDIVAAIIIDGSYVTGKDAPEDIDVIVVLRADVDLLGNPGSFGQRLVEKRALKREFGVEAFAFPNGDPQLARWVELFTQVRPDDPDQATSKTKKGLLRIELC